MPAAHLTWPPRKQASGAWTEKAAPPGRDEPAPGTRAKGPFLETCGTDEAPRPRPCRRLLRASRLFSVSPSGRMNSPRFKPAELPRSRGFWPLCGSHSPPDGKRSSLSSPKKDTQREGLLHTRVPGGTAVLQTAWRGPLGEPGPPQLEAYGLFPTRGHGGPKHGQRRGSSEKSVSASAEPPPLGAVQDVACQAHQQPCVPVSR